MHLAPLASRLFFTPPHAHCVYPTVHATPPPSTHRSCHAGKFTSSHEDISFNVGLVVHGVAMGGVLGSGSGRGYKGIIEDVVAGTVRQFPSRATKSRCVAPDCGSLGGGAAAVLLRQGGLWMVWWRGGLGVEGGGSEGACTSVYSGMSKAGSCVIHSRSTPSTLPSLLTPPLTSPHHHRHRPAPTPPPPHPCPLSPHTSNPLSHLGYGLFAAACTYPDPCVHGAASQGGPRGDPVKVLVSSAAGASQSLDTSYLASVGRGLEGFEVTCPVAVLPQVRPCSCDFVVKWYAATTPRPLPQLFVALTRRQGGVVQARWCLRQG